ncbi:MAG: fumarate hydratase, partial [Anaerolineales bacterium]
DLEERITEQANQLGIGPMGFGGKTTVLGTKIKSLHRLPASYFVSVSYMCWAYRRRKMTYTDGQVRYH